MDFVLRHRRSSISVQDLLCQNSSETSSCPTPTPQPTPTHHSSSPSSAALSCPPLSLPQTTHTLINDLTPTSFSDQHQPYPDPRADTSADPSPPPPDALGNRPKPVRGPWRIEEDRLLIDLVARYGPKHWSSIATHFRRRSGKQARERWMNQLNPTLKKKNWTAYEDRTILRLHASLGNKWSAIAQVLPGRTDNSVKNRYNSTLKRAIKERGLTPNNFHIDHFVENLHARHFVVPPSFHHPHLPPMEEQPQQVIPTRVCAKPEPHTHPAPPHYLDPFRIDTDNQGPRLVDQTSHAWARKRAHYGLGSHQTNLAADAAPAPQYARQSGERLPTFQEMLENSAPLEPNRLQRLAAQDVRESSPCTLTHAALPSHDAPTPTTAVLDDRGTQRRVLYPTDNLAPSRDILSPSKSIAKRRHGWSCF